MPMCREQPLAELKGDVGLPGQRPRSTRHTGLEKGGSRGFLADSGWSKGEVSRGDTVHTDGCSGMDEGAHRYGPTGLFSLCVLG